LESFNWIRNESIVPINPRAQSEYKETGLTDGNKSTALNYVPKVYS